MYSKEIKKIEIINGLNAIKKVGSKKIDLVEIEFFQHNYSSQLEKLDRTIISNVITKILRVIKESLKSELKKVLNICFVTELEPNYEVGEYHYVTFRFLLLGKDLDGIKEKLMNPLEAIVLDEIGGGITIEYKHNMSHPEVMSELLPIDTLTPKQPKTTDKKLKSYYSDELYEVAKTPIMEFNPRSLERGVITIQLN